jgi:hypothetical protein
MKSNDPKEELNQKLCRDLHADAHSARRAGFLMWLFRMDTREGLQCPGCYLRREDLTEGGLDLPAAPCLAASDKDTI